MSFNRLTQDISYISKLADKPNQAGMSAAELKAEFDKSGNVIKTFINSFFDTLEGNTGASNIGIQPIAGMTANKVQSALSELYAKAATIGTSQLANGAVTADKLNAAAVTTVKIAEGNVTKNKLAEDAKSKGIEVSLSFTDTTLSVSVPGVTEDSNVLVAPAKASEEIYTDCEIYCSGQGDGTLIFTASEIPSETLTANVILLV